jgi:hypothetical protein
MIACLCGGVIEAGAIGLFVVSASSITTWIINMIRRCKCGDIRREVRS